MSGIDALALFIGDAILIAGGVALFAGLMYVAIYWITYAVNQSHHRVAGTIAGKDYLDVLRKYAAQQHEKGE